eukprot:2815088-Amphidinium_carterae.1
MQGKKPRYEIRITNNYQTDRGLRDLDITIISYRMLQGHFSRIGWDGQAEGSDPDEISTVMKLVAEMP